MKKCFGFEKVTKTWKQFKVHNKNTIVASILFLIVLLLVKGWGPSDKTSANTVFVFEFSSETFFYIDIWILVDTTD